MLAMGLVFALSAWAQQKPVAPVPLGGTGKPFTQDQVQGLVRDGLGDESGAKLIEQRGIDFAPVEDFLETLKASGASEAFLKAVRAAKPLEPASPKKPLNEVQVFVLLAGQVPSHRVTMLVQERGIDFEPGDDYLQELSVAHLFCKVCGPSPRPRTGAADAQNRSALALNSLGRCLKIIDTFRCGRDTCADCW